MSSCDAILLGRNTYQMFEPAWSARTADEDPGAPFMNESTKYVVSSTLKEGAWQNSNDRRPVQRRSHPQGQGRSRRRHLRERQLHARTGAHRRRTARRAAPFVYPVTRGGGPRLFPDNVPTNWPLINSSTYDNGVLYLAYRAAAS